tara:strand:+ start:296 stop:541 length:246 start_codon:yes stop_codon:yes gene_type:complete
MTYDVATKRGRRSTKPKLVAEEHQYIDIKVELALLTQTVNLLKDNHLPHIQKDIDYLKKGMFWFFGTVLISVLSLHLTNLF